MKPSNLPALDTSPPNSPFPQTRWSLIANARDEDPQALADLCQGYWLPLYGYARRLRPDPADAEDLTQAFFERLLAKGGFAKADAARGKLRTFLLCSLKNFASEDWRRGQRQKRGGKVPHVAIDSLEAEQRMALEPREGLTPELEFDRAWARQLLERVLAKLEASYREAGKGPLFAALRDQLVPGGATEKPYAQIADELGVSEPSVRFGAFKLRNRYREMLKEAVLETVSSEEEAAEELRHLRAVFGD